MALGTRRVLSAWRAGRHGRPHIVMASGKCAAFALEASTRSQASDISPHLQGKFVLMDGDHAAAAITAGHGVRNYTPHGFEISENNIFNKAVTATMLAAVAASVTADPARCPTMPLPEFKPGEHPFLYALASLSQARELLNRAQTMDPTWKFTSKHSEKFAFVSQSIMDGATPETLRARDQLLRHVR